MSNELRKVARDFMVQSVDARYSFNFSVDGASDYPVSVGSGSGSGDYLGCQTRFDY